MVLQWPWCCLPAYLPTCLRCFSASCGGPDPHTGGAAIVAACRYVEKQHGGAVHFLFNNAGIGISGPFLELPRASWDKCFQVNFHGVVWMTRAFLPMCIAADKSAICNTSSINGFWACLGPDALPHTTYSASKFAVSVTRVIN